MSPLRAALCLPLRQHPRPTQGLGCPTQHWCAHLQALFGGSLRSDVTCCACGHTSTRHEHFSHISLDIPTPTAFQPPALNAGGGGRAAAGSGGRGSPSKGGRGSNAGSGRAAAAAVTEGSTGSAEAMANGTTATAAAASWGAGQGGCSRPLADLTKASEGSLRTGVGLEPHTRHQQQQQQEEEEEEEEEEQRRANLSLGQAAAGATGQWADWAPAAACTGSLGTAPGTFEAASGVRGPGGGALVIDDSEDAAQVRGGSRARTGGGCCCGGGGLSLQPSSPPMLPLGRPPAPTHCGHCPAWTLDPGLISLSTKLPSFWRLTEQGGPRFPPTSGARGQLFPLPTPGCSALCCCYCRTPCRPPGRVPSVPLASSISSRVLPVPLVLLPLLQACPPFTPGIAAVAVADSSSSMASPPSEAAAVGARCRGSTRG